MIGFVQTLHWNMTLFHAFAEKEKAVHFVRPIPFMTIPYNKVRSYRLQVFFCKRRLNLHRKLELSLTFTLHLPCVFASFQLYLLLPDIMISFFILFPILSFSHTFFVFPLFPFLLPLFFLSFSFTSMLSFLFSIPSYTFFPLTSFNLLLFS